MASFSKHRKKIWIESEVQGKLVLKCCLYWFFCISIIMLFVAIATVFSGKLQSAGELSIGIWRQFSPAILASILLLPIVVVDVIRTSHRFAGPVYRLKSEMKKMADGEEVAPIRFRKGDHWHDLAEEFNRLVEYHRQMQTRFKKEVSDSKNTESKTEVDPVGTPLT